MSGNSNSGGNGKTARRGHELVQRTRAAILNAMDVLDKGTEPLSVLLAKAATEQPMRFLDMAAKHCPKDIDLNIISDLKAENMTDNELADIIATRARERRELEDKQALESQSPVESTA